MNAGVASLVVNGFREARRNRVTVVVLAFAVLLVLSSSTIASAAIVTLDRVLVDVALGSASLLLIALAIYLSCGALNSEIQRRTIFIIMSKPISRSAFLMARLGSILLTLAVLEMLMVALFAVEVVAFRASFQPAQFVAFGMLFVELSLLVAFGVLLSTFAGPIVSAVVVAGVYFAGHQARDIHLRAGKSASALVRGVAHGVYYLLPNLERLDFKPHAAYGLPVTASEVLHNAAYGFAYTAAVLVLATIVFARRDFK
jgi:ABC-type transport system involved in multi-copper enzyme maturation permease subunit